jgi:hypothetical protein
LSEKNYEISQKIKTLNLTLLLKDHGSGYLMSQKCHVKGPRVAIYECEREKSVVRVRARAVVFCASCSAITLIKLCREGDLGGLTEIQISFFGGRGNFFVVFILVW